MFTPSASSSGSSPLRSGRSGARCAKSGPPCSLALGLVGLERILLTLQHADALSEELGNCLLTLVLHSDYARN